ncbi:hypothetical protein [Aquitalea magnusonii]|uniref:hypothetical protein n=1 Tax=Aquitalea magnusonii TaxID=332411 RepID=UPI0007504C27|nr:hypothetical protein [Aquitalea magnusonii]
MNKARPLCSESPPIRFRLNKKNLRVFPMAQGPRFVAADVAKLLKYPDEAALQTALGGKAGCLLSPASGPALLTLSEAELRHALRAGRKTQRKRCNSG